MRILRILARNTFTEPNGSREWVGNSDRITRLIETFTSAKISRFVLSTIKK